MDPIYLINLKGDGTYKVLKIVPGDEPDELTKAAAYDVSGVGCTCKRFAFDRDCKHLKMVSSKFVGKPLTLSEARAEVRKAIQQFGADYHFAGMADDPYEKDGSGNVTCATVVFRGPRFPTELLGPGTWEGLLSSGLRIRMVVG